MKRIFRYGRRVIACLIFAVCMVVINEGLRYLLIDDAESYTRITLHELYGQENIDVLFLGSSHCYRSIDPAVTDAAWNMNTFNAGTSSQQPVASYYLLKEAGERNRISRVYMEVYYDLLSNNEVYQSPTAAYIISDYMRPSLNRLQFLWDTGGKDYLVHGLILAKRDWEKLFDAAYLKENLHRKTSDSYREYAWVRAENEEYAGKGFVYNKEQIQKGTFSALEPFAPVDSNGISARNQEYLRKIIDYCRDKGIELIFYSAPVPDFRLAGCGNYDSYVEQMYSFLEGTGVPYYDFNLCRSDFLQMDDGCFKDDNHLNGEGAERFSEAFAAFFGGKTDGDRIFWDSYGQKLEHERKDVFGIICEMEKDEEGKIRAHIIPVANSEGPLWFSVIKRKEDEAEYKEYREFSEDMYFWLPAGETGYFHILTSTDPEGGNIVNDAGFYYG